MTVAELNTIVRAARQARKGGFATLSISQQLAAALVLNRADWLACMNFTMADALEHVGPRWLALIPAACRVLRDEPADRT